MCICTLGDYALVMDRLENNGYADSNFQYSRETHKIKVSNINKEKGELIFDIKNISKDLNSEVVDNFIGSLTT